MWEEYKKKRRNSRERIGQNTEVVWDKIQRHLGTKYRGIMGQNILAA